MLDRFLHTTVSHNLGSALKEDETYIRDGEFAEIMARHFRLDFNGIEDFAIINPDDTSNHFRHNNHIP